MDINMQQVVSDIKHAYQVKNFNVAIIKTNKGHEMPLFISKKLSDQYVGKEPTYTECENMPDLRVLFRYTEALCVGGVLKIMSYNEYVNDYLGKNPHKPKDNLHFVLGLVTNTFDFIQQNDELLFVSLNAEEALKRHQAKEKFEQYAKIPELQDLMTSNQLTLQDFTY